MQAHHTPTTKQWTDGTASEMKDGTTVKIRWLCDLGQYIFAMLLYFHLYMQRVPIFPTSLLSLVTGGMCHRRQLFSNFLFLSISINLHFISPLYLESRETTAKDKMTAGITTIYLWRA